MTRGFAPAPRGTFVSAKVPKAILPRGLRPAPHFRCGQPRTGGCLSGSADGTSMIPTADAWLAALRFPCSRLQVQGSPSVASPFSGTKVHRAFVLIRFTPPGPHKGERDVQGCTSAANAGSIGAAFGGPCPRLDRRGEKIRNTLQPKIIF